MSGRARRRVRAKLPVRSTRAGVSIEDSGGVHDLATRERLLEAGRRLFVAKGFAKVTVRELTDEARANLAAVSYHFRDKLGLYMDVVREAIEASGAIFESTRAPADTPPDERLRHYVTAMLHRMADVRESKAWIQQIMGHEMMSPTPALSFIVEKAIRPRLDYLADIVAELLGCSRTDPRVGLCVASIHAQFVFHMRSPMRDIAFATWGLAQMHPDQVAEHIAEFVLGGVRAVAVRTSERSSGRHTRRT